MLYYDQNMRETEAPPNYNLGSDLPPSTKSAERKYIMNNRRNPVRFAVDFANKQIIATETVLNRAKRYGSSEYIELCRLASAHPQFSIVKKEVEQSAKKKTYKRLSFAFMEEFISIHPDADKLMKEYRAVREVTLEWDTGAYPRTKSWFLKKFGTQEMPFDMKKAEEDILAARIAAGQASA